jgi:Arc/MetJ-type ribon-helix-helix transcriptional regulator
MLYNRVMAIGFRPTDDDERIIESFKREGESTSDVIRRGLRSLERLAWEEEARADMARLALEDLSDEPDAWEYDENGNIRVIGTDIVVSPRKGTEQ